MAHVEFLLYINTSINEIYQVSQDYSVRYEWIIDQINNFRSLKSTPLSNNLSSPNSGYLDKGLFKDSLDTAIRFLSRFVAMSFYNQISIQSFCFFLREAKS
jgi:hypothetical protein